MASTSVSFREPDPLPLEDVFKKKAKNLEKKLIQSVPSKNEDIYSKIRRRALSELKTKYENLAHEISLAKDQKLRRNFIAKFQILNKKTAKGESLKKIKREYYKRIHPNANLKK